MGAGRTIARIVMDAVVAGARSALRTSSRSSSPSRSSRSPSRSSSRSTPRPPSRSSSTRSPAPPADGYPGDFTGRVRVEYAPHRDGQADPGEVVWGWVPFEEDHSRGKDRPVLVVGRDGGWLLGLMLTSKDHDRDAAQEARWGRLWMDVGSGAWDPQRRPSEVRLDRVLRLDPERVRREGAALDERTFRAVTTEAGRVNGW